MKKSIIFLFAVVWLYFCFPVNVFSQAGGIPPSVLNFMSNVPGNVLVGIGVAKTESEGESILLAEHRAREELVRVINTTDTMLSARDDLIVELFANAVISGARVALRARDNNGYWWCVATLPGEAVLFDREGISMGTTPYRVVPQRNDITEILRLNAGVSIDAANVPAVFNIPDWVFDSYRNQPNNLIVGLGAANLGNDQDSISLAMERARRSIAYQLESDISTRLFNYEAPIGSLVHEELMSSATSVYNHTLFERRLLQYTKTRDGTWWILLGCPVMMR
jgi:hypothetical protein